jgi:hypothetical protein
MKTESRRGYSDTHTHIERERERERGDTGIRAVLPEVLGCAIALHGWIYTKHVRKRLRKRRSATQI